MSDGFDAPFGGEFTGSAGMKDEEVDPEELASDEFVFESVEGFELCFGIGGAEVDEVCGVRDDGLNRGVKESGFKGIGFFLSPHALSPAVVVFSEDLEGVALVVNGARDGVVWAAGSGVVGTDDHRREEGRRLLRGVEGKKGGRVNEGELVEGRR